LAQVFFTCVHLSASVFHLRYRQHGRKSFTSSNTNEKQCPAIYACQNKLNNKDNEIIREKYGILSRKNLLYSTACQRKMFAYGRQGSHITSGYIFSGTLPRLA
jgi:hypothetical protein